jgi:hypothetical protein
MMGNHNRIEKDVKQRTGILNGRAFVAWIRCRYLLRVPRYFSASLKVSDPYLVLIIQLRTAYHSLHN